MTVSLTDIMDEEMNGWVDLQNREGALVRGHDKNISAAEIKVTFKEGLPYVPFWEPILEEKPDWVLDAVRTFGVVWIILGFMAFCVFKAKPVEDGEKPKED